MVRGAPVLMVGPDPGVVERELVAGGLACPACGGQLRPWGHVQRWLRGRGSEQLIGARRSRCRACLVTHVLLPVVALGRRLDLAEVIGAALAARAAGAGHRRVAAGLGLPASTVRGWLRRFAARAELLRGHFTALAYRLDPELGPITPRGSPLADAVAAIGVAAAAAVRRWGPAEPWAVAAGASGGWLLGNTSPLFAAGW
jgi:Domain of unknown function (DUF6431)